MKLNFRRRPSPALVIACIALFVSLGGVSWAVATGSIDSREIQNNTIRSKDVRNNTLRTFDIRNNEVRGFDIRNSTIQGRDVALNTLTGADISETSLAQVPSAAAADKATDAATVGGVALKKVFAKLPAGAGTTPIFVSDYFVLQAACPGGDADLSIAGVANAPATNATVQSVRNTPQPLAGFESTAALVPGPGLALLNGGQQGSATVVVSTTDGRVSTVVIAAKDSPAFTGENACAIRGMVTSG